MSSSQAINAGSKRIRKISRAQQEINNNEFDRIARMEADLARKKKRLLKKRQQAEESDNDDDPESQDEEDQGQGRMPGGGFTSVISSKGVVQTLGKPRAKKRRLLQEKDVMSDPAGSHSSTRQPLQDLNVNNIRQTQSSPPPARQSQVDDDLLNFDDEEGHGSNDDQGRGRRHSPSMPAHSPDGTHSHNHGRRSIRRSPSMPADTHSRDRGRRSMRRSPSTPDDGRGHQSARRSPSSPDGTHSHNHGRRSTHRSPSVPADTDSRGRQSTRRSPSTPNQPRSRGRMHRSPSRGSATGRSPGDGQSVPRSPSMPIQTPERSLSRQQRGHHSKNKQLPLAPFCDGKKPGKNPKAADYEESVEKMLLNAMHEFSCLIFTTDAFPDDKVQIRWAWTVWKNACHRVNVHYELSHRMIRLITDRGSWARGMLKDAARTHFKEYYKFKKGEAEDTKTYNKELRTALLSDDAFHYKVSLPVDPQIMLNISHLLGFSPIIADIIETALFEDVSGSSGKSQKRLWLLQLLT
ncbi:hypothetical protein F5887DRAFT_1078611 [Amanita rubescens]|nr:hypothetical protein F5887DRAFT_1078611 [Amanita rubescens]